MLHDFWSSDFCLVGVVLLVYLDDLSFQVAGHSCCQMKGWILTKLLLFFVLPLFLLSFFESCLDDSLLEFESVTISKLMQTYSTFFVQKVTKCYFFSLIKHFWILKSSTWRNYNWSKDLCWGTLDTQLKMLSLPKILRIFFISKYFTC